MRVILQCNRYTTVAYAASVAVYVHKTETILKCM